ncbi:MAG TPA: hypothetical protein DDY31_14795 [Lachnospiraceae bacterium]|nr:hypothetical protein [Lachnospiraceae bacterium]
MTKSESRHYPVYTDRRLKVSVGTAEHVEGENYPLCSLTMLMIQSDGILLGNGVRDIEILEMAQIEKYQSSLRQKYK